MGKKSCEPHSSVTDAVRRIGGGPWLPVTQQCYGCGEKDRRRSMVASYTAVLRM